MLGVRGVVNVVGFNYTASKNLVPTFFGVDDITYLHLAAEFPCSKACILVARGSISKLNLHRFTHSVQRFIFGQIANLFPSNEGDTVFQAAVQLAGVFAGRKHPIPHGCGYINGELLLLSFEILHFLDKGDIGEFGVIGETVLPRCN